MKLRKALRLVMARWNLTYYRLAQVSGITEATIGKILREEHKAASWDVVEQLADGLGKLDPAAKVSFLAILGLPDHYYSELNNPTAIPVEPHNEIIKETIKILNKGGFIDREVVKSSEVTSLYDNHPLETSLVDWVLFRMARYRQHKDKQKDKQAES